MSERLTAEQRERLEAAEARAVRARYEAARKRTPVDEMDREERTIHAILAAVVIVGAVCVVLIVRLVWS